jgi:trans-2,3-dihydro-3-hydroxyanthranilate isomerase
MARTFGYSVVDVFAERALEGNPLAVFHDARGLSDAEMQALARETNLSETTFVLPSENPDEDRVNGMRVRIFTAQEELPFAGHPSLGTASWLYANHPVLKGVRDMTLRLNVGPIPVSFAQDDRGGEGVFATMRQNDPVFGREHSVTEVARVIGLREEDLLPGYLPQTVSTGNPFCIVALRSVEALGRLAIPPKESAEWLKAQETRWFYCIAPMEGKAQWRARMQFYGGEDPATGSAAGCCISWLVQQGLAKADAAVLIEQGVEILRPSLITTNASVIDGRVCDVRVAGRTIPVASGSFFLL